MIDVVDGNYYLKCRGTENKNGIAIEQILMSSFESILFEAKLSKFEDNYWTSYCTSSGCDIIAYEDAIFEYTKLIK